MKKIITLSFIFHCITGYCSSQFEGAWLASRYVGTGKVPEATYTILLKKNQNNKFVGAYCFITQFGNRIDCGDESENNIFETGSRRNDQINISFTPFFGRNRGTAVLSLDGDHLRWDVVSIPDGDQYLGPLHLTLNRKRGPLNEATIQIDKAHLYDEIPSTNPVSHGYLIRGDRVTTTDLSDNGKYWRILYIGKDGRSINRWISCKAIRKCFH